jgi:hypothetical protein
MHVTFDKFKLYLSICLPVYIPNYLPTYLSTYLPIYLSVYLSVYIPTYLPIYNPIYLSIYLSVCLSVYLSLALQTLLDLGHIFSFLILYTVSRTPWTGDQSVAKPLLTHRKTQTHNKRTQTSKLWMGLEPTTPVFERSKTVHALDRAATAIGVDSIQRKQFQLFRTLCCLR